GPGRFGWSAQLRDGVPLEDARHGTALGCPGQAMDPADRGRDHRRGDGGDYSEGADRVATALMLPTAADLTSVAQELSSLLRSLRDALDPAVVVERAWTNSLPSLAMIFPRLVLVTGNPFQSSPDESGFEGLAI